MSNQSLGGTARAKNLTKEQKNEIARKAANARWDKEKQVPKAQYSGVLNIGDLSFPCSVLSNGERVLTQTAFMRGMGMYYSGWVSKNRTPEEHTADVPQFLAYASLRPYIDRNLGDLQSIVVKYRTKEGKIAHGIKASTIPKICYVWIDAEKGGKLGTTQQKIAERAAVITRSLAQVGIVALVDEATGYQKDRSADALARILEKFIATELQPWVKTFPDDFYEQLFRLRGLNYLKDQVKRPQYFGYLTNDIIYKRLAPSVLEEIKKQNEKKTTHLHRRLSQEVGHPKLREHISSVVTAMKLSENYQDFVEKLDRIHPRFEEGMQLEFDYDSGM